MMVRAGPRRRLRKVDAERASRAAGADGRAEHSRRAPSWIATETFARADAAELGNAGSGQTWTASIGTFNISGNSAVPSAAADTVAYVQTDVAGHWATVQVAVLRNSAPHWVVVRLVDCLNYYRFGTTPGNIELLDIWRMSTDAPHGVASVRHRAHSGTAPRPPARRFPVTPSMVRG
jgi:hypothetical protein